MAAPSFNHNILAAKADVFELHPVEDDDVETPGLWVKDYDVIKTSTTKDGFVVTSLRAVLSNDSKYKGRITKAADPEHTFERMASISPAWITDEEDPFNVNWSKKLAEKGVTTVDTSHEHVLHMNPRKTVKRFVGSSLLNDTHAQLAMMDLVRSEGLAGKVSDEVIGTGLSKSSIRSLLMIGRAAAYNLRVPYIDGIDPSGEHQWGKRDLRSLSRMGSGTLTELKEIGEIATEYSPPELIDAVRHHLLMSPQAIAGHLAATRSLVLSEAGKDFITPAPESIMHITCFRNCWFNQHRGWMRRLGDLENVHVEPLPGGHLRGGREEIRRSSVERIVRVQELLESGISSQDIDPATQTPRQQLAA